MTRILHFHVFAMVTAFAVTGCRVTGPATQSDPKIIGGVPAGDAFPAVQILRVGWRFCSGTFISPSHFLTAAHCLRDDSGVDAALAEIHVGTDGETPVSVAIHPGYGKGPRFDVNHDVAILTVSARAGRPSTRIARRSPRIHDVVTIVGYGSTSRNSILPSFTKSIGRNSIVQFIDARVAIANHSTRVTEGSALLGPGDSGGGWFNQEGDLIAVSSSGTETFSEAVLVGDRTVLPFIQDSMVSRADGSM